MSDLACGIPQWRSNLSLEAVHFWSRRFPLSGVLGETQCFRWVFLPHQMASRLPYLLKTSVLVLVLWRLIRRIRPKPRPLANIRGPSKEHWLKGNYHRIFQDGLQYNLHLAHTYGGALKIHAVLGAEQLYISDPLALQHIVIRDQDIYEETDMFIIGNGLIFGQGLISTLGKPSTLLSISAGQVAKGNNTRGNAKCSIRSSRLPICVHFHR